MSLNSERCPYCFSKFADLKYTDDPILTKDGSFFVYDESTGLLIPQTGTKLYKGCTIVKNQHIIELQEANDDNKPSPDWTPVEGAPGSFWIPNKIHIKELRDAIEKGLGITGSTTPSERTDIMEQYLNYDEEGVERQNPHQLDWNDPTLTDAIWMGSISHMHIEDLRKNFIIGIERWNVWKETSQNLTNEIFKGDFGLQAWTVNAMINPIVSYKTTGINEVLERGTGPFSYYTGAYWEFGVCHLSHVTIQSPMQYRIQSGQVDAGTKYSKTEISDGKLLFEIRPTGSVTEIIYPRFDYTPITANSFCPPYTEQITIGFDFYYTSVTYGTLVMQGGTVNYSGTPNKPIPINSSQIFTADIFLETSLGKYEPALDNNTANEMYPTLIIEITLITNDNEIAIWTMTAHSQSDEIWWNDKNVGINELSPEETGEVYNIQEYRYLEDFIGSTSYTADLYQYIITKPLFHSAKFSEVSISCSIPETTLHYPANIDSPQNISRTITDGYVTGSIDNIGIKTKESV